MEGKLEKMCASRGLDDKDIVNGLAKILVRIKEDNIRETVGRIKVTATPEANFKALNSVDVRTLADTLEWFGREVKDLNKSGICFNILLEVTKQLPYVCGGCSAVVDEDFKAESAKCFGCGAGACKNCEYQSTGAVVYVCLPCSNHISSRFNTPTSGLKKKALHRVQVQAQVHKEREQEKGNTEAEGGSSGDSADELPNGQGSPQKKKRDEEDPDGINVLDTDSDEDFLEPPRRVKKKERKKRKDLKENTKEVKKQDKAKVCFHFLRGVCRHGFRGVTPADGKSKCSYDHPKLCKRILNHGVGKGGCSKGKECPDIHPKMCPKSVNSGKCPSKGRCNMGYHVRGTVMDDSSKIPQRNSKSVECAKDVESVKTFLAGVVQEELVKLLKPQQQLLPPPQPLPQVQQYPQQTSQGQAWEILKSILVK